MLNTQEFIDIMNQFEKDAKGLIRFGSQGLTREDKTQWAKGNYYSDGNTNFAFKMFLHGVSFGKCYYN